ncbi:hypothetical protein QBC37DRAFT_393297 [Rhypophila decipiens]|uniref:CBM1 domain-containing protein n=1 Tax=Rhypophila decipiens TaxID=261697 RepID=A0AAN7B1D3_9PEZI|nr:hypothetical protein QBC37DRAFT_393297 [Rhypophila decipiens]
MRVITTVPLLAATVAAQSPVSPYGQCGGWAWAGPTGCGQGYYCTTYNSFYAQCIPGAAPATSTTSSSRTVAPPITTTTTLVTITTPPSNPNPTPTVTIPAGSVPTTLVSPNYWIRAVAAPNYRKYLQPAIPFTPGKAIISSHTTASQLYLDSTGQLTLYRGAGVAPLYLNIENPSDKTQRKLATEFKETKNSYGKFGFQGDTLTWSVGEIKRPNEAAWLVCGDGKELFVNTGAYGWDTPAGCSDQTIHSYGGATADT